jgi:hypothetical protein
MEDESNATAMDSKKARGQMRRLVARGVMLIAMVAVGWSVNQVWADTVHLAFGFFGHHVTNLPQPGRF